MARRGLILFCHLDDSDSVRWDAEQPRATTIQVTVDDAARSGVSRRAASEAVVPGTLGTGPGGVTRYSPFTAASLARKAVYAAAPGTLPKADEPGTTRPPRFGNRPQETLDTFSQAAGPAPDPLRPGVLRPRATAAGFLPSFARSGGACLRTKRARAQRARPMRKYHVRRQRLRVRASGEPWGLSRSQRARSSKVVHWRSAWRNPSPFASARSSRRARKGRGLQDQAPAGTVYRGMVVGRDEDDDNGVAEGRRVWRVLYDDDDTAGRRRRSILRPSARGQKRSRGRRARLRAGTTRTEEGEEAHDAGDTAGAEAGRAGEAGRPRAL